MKKLFAVFLLTSFAYGFAQAQSCTTSSRGYSFSGQNGGAVLNSCYANQYTVNAECDRNLVCSSFGGGNGGGWNPPPQQPPAISRDGQCYLRNYPDICQNSPQNYCQDPEKHWREHGQYENRVWGCRPLPPQGPSDAQCYLNRYPDICQNSPNNYCRDPQKHYNEHGRGEGRIWGCR